jgi:hypothetical protein
MWPATATRGGEAGSLCSSAWVGPLCKLRPPARWPAGCRLVRATATARAPPSCALDSRLPPSQGRRALANPPTDCCLVRATARAPPSCALDSQ